MDRQMDTCDVVVVGSGPNGLTAAVTLALHGLKVSVLEGSPTPGGGTRTEEATLEGFRHDLCSAVHPTGFLSPIFNQLRLDLHGLEWIHSPNSVAHPLDGQDAVHLMTDIEATALQLGPDSRSYRSLIGPLSRDFHNLIGDALQPLDFPKHPIALARFGIHGLNTAMGLSRNRFSGERAKALWAGCAAHSILPLNFCGTAAVGLIFLLSGHVASWPVAKTGSIAITQALLRVLKQSGGEIQCGRLIRSLNDLPPAKAYLFDTSPRQLASIAADALPEPYRRRLGRYQYGPAVFKIDYALSSRIPWSDPACSLASTVHVGGSLEEIAFSERQAWEGRIVENPFVMVCQQSHYDATRAPAGFHTGYAYCHVASGSTESMIERIERQIERFAPGFKDCILHRSVMDPAAMQAHNPSNTGGAITGGAARLSQLFFRPVARFDPYATPNPQLFICSHATPPGGGVHGMCGYNAAKSVLRRLKVPLRTIGQGRS